MIEKATPADHQALTTLTKKSKAHWGYSAAQMQQWDEELTVTPDYIRKNNTYKLVDDNARIMGYYAYRTLSDDQVKLDNLFVLPSFIGNGYGQQLMTHFLAQATREGFRRVLVDADPNAEGFYARQGFVVVGKKTTAIVGRYLPVMERGL